MNLLLIASAAAAALQWSVSAQGIGTNKAEQHPPLTVHKCTAAGGCSTSKQSIVLDANWRWLHTAGGSTNCFTGNKWDTSICSDPVTCAQKCVLDGADYTGTYGITSTGGSLRINFVTQSQGRNVGSRVYLMDPSDNQYQMFNLKNQEFTFDVDVSNLPCGLNGALYFSEMLPDGGLSEYPNNKAGARYGTGYCDAQCPQDIKFIKGEANILGWSPSSNNANTGAGRYGSCCHEMDIWEANSVSSAYTPHVCSFSGLYRCDSSTGTDCGAGDERFKGACDKNGCDFNSYRMGNQNFFGAGKTVDTTKPFTVVTQFITSDNTTSGDLIEIRRKYVQGGKVVENSFSTFPGLTQFNSVSDTYCSAQEKLFADNTTFEALGGLKLMGDAMSRGMVLVMSLWDDYDVNMQWLDSTFPPGATSPGSQRGSCAQNSGVPAQVERDSANAFVIFSNVRWGDIGSTFTGSTLPSVFSTPASPSQTVTATSTVVASTTVPAPSPTGTCTVTNPACTDTYPFNDGYSCAQQAGWGKCNEAFIINANACEKTCNRCPGPVTTCSPGCKLVTVDCVDTYPYNDGFSCAKQAGWGKCNEAFIVDVGACQKTCNHCPQPTTVCTATSVSPASSTPPSSTSTFFKSTTSNKTSVSPSCTPAPPCADTYPFTDGHSCAEQAGWGKCDADWMVSANACQKTCNRCPTSNCGNNGGGSGGGLLYSAINAEGLDYWSGPDLSTIDFYTKDFANLVRLEILWEKAQSSYYGDLDSNYMAKVDSAIATANANGAAVLLNPQSFAHFNDKISSNNADQFANFWSKIASRYMNNSAVWFGFVNEPHDIGSSEWFQICQKAIDAIRKTGSTNKLSVPGVQYTGAWAWTKYNGNDPLSIRDSANNFHYEMHQYWDSDRSGTHDNDCSLGINELDSATQWLRSNGKKALLAETGVGNSGQCVNLLDRALSYLEANSDVWIGFGWWVTGPYGQGKYWLDITPFPGESPKPQVAILRKHAGSERL